MCIFSWYTLGNLTIKSLSCMPFEGVIGTAGILASRTILRIYYRSFFKHLALKDVEKSISEGLGLGIELGIEGLWAKSLFSSSILLLIGKKT